MMKNIKETTKRHFRITLYGILYLVLQVLISQSGRHGFAAFNGVINSLQLLLCFFMVMVEYNLGGYFALVLISLGLIDRLIAAFGLRVISAIPGLCNMVVFAIILFILQSQFRIRDRAAVTDSLTGLKNRKGLYRTIFSKIDSNKPFFIIGINLSNFRTITENYGNRCCENILLEVSRRINPFVGKRGTVAVMDGNRFFIVLNGENDPQEFAAEVLRIISEKIVAETDGSTAELFLNPYAGIARFPYDGNKCDTLIKYADIALYNAEIGKKDKVKFFDMEMEKELTRRNEIEKLVRKSLENDYFYLVYQPQFSVSEEKSGKYQKLRGFESLIRLRTPEGVNVSPGEFVPVAEKTDLSLKIDDYVLHRAMKEFCGIVKEKTDLIISVNVSARNIGSLGFYKKVMECLDETGFPARNLEIEITEYSLVKSIATTSENISRLREKGVHVALDDFGTGYTSLSYLAKLPINLLKIDKSLIDDIEENQKSLDFVSAVISMGHLMNCEVISEGVETEEQLSLLGNRGSDYVQGFVWGKPMEFPAAEELALKD